MDIDYYSKWISFGLFSLAAVIHIGYFIVESFLLQNVKNSHLLKIKPSDHQAIKVWAFNQGFYNLALALQMIIGLMYVLKGEPKTAGLLVGLSGLTMIMAGVVLFFSAPQLRRGALMQILPPLLGFLFLSSHILF